MWRGTHSDTLMMTSGWSSTASEPDELSEIGALTLGSSGAGSSMIIFCHGRQEEESGCAQVRRREVMRGEWHVMPTRGMCVCPKRGGESERVVGQNDGDAGQPGLDLRVVNRSCSFAHLGPKAGTSDMMGWCWVGGLWLTPGSKLGSRCAIAEMACGGPQIAQVWYASCPDGAGVPLGRGRLSNQGSQHVECHTLVPTVAAERPSSRGEG